MTRPIPSPGRVTGAQSSRSEQISAPHCADLTGGLSRDYLLNVIDNKGTVREDIDACMKSFYEGPSEEKAAYLRSLKARGYKIFMLSNNNPIMMRICADDFSRVGISLTDFFDKIFISSTMKLMKPGQEIYLEAIRQSGLQADELLFIDDSPRNTEAARIAGIPSIDYVQGSDLAALIEAALRH